MAGFETPLKTRNVLKLCRLWLICSSVQNGNYEETVWTYQTRLTVADARYNTP